MKTNNRTYLEFDVIVIKSYKHGLVLDIGSENSSYHSNLIGLLKKLFSIKLSNKRMIDLHQLESLLKTVYSEVSNIAKRLDQIIKQKTPEERKIYFFFQPSMEV